MGIDIGWNDGTGMTVARARDPEPGVHVLEAYREAELSVPRMAAIAGVFRSAQGNRAWAPSFWPTALMAPITLSSNCSFFNASRTR